MLYVRRVCQLYSMSYNVDSKRIPHAEFSNVLVTERHDLINDQQNRDTELCYLPALQSSPVVLSFAFVLDPAVHDHDKSG
jgi:hypothetical protein